MIIGFDFYELYPIIGLDFFKNKQKGIRITLENFGEMDKIDIYPLYEVLNLNN